MLAKRGLISFIVLTLLLSNSYEHGTAFAQGGESGFTPVDSILLMDSSSRVYRDIPQDQQYNAGNFALDYLEKVSQTVRVTFRAGVSSFGDAKGPSIPLQSLRDSQVRITPDDLGTPYPNIQSALDFAYQQFRDFSFDFGPERKTGIILVVGNAWLSNGSHERNGIMQRGRDNVEDIGLVSTIGQLNASGVQVYVIVTDSAVKDEALWKRLLKDQDGKRVWSAKDPKVLTSVYHELAARLAGSITRLNQVIHKSHILPISFSPFLEQAVFVFIKDSRVAYSGKSRVTITDPDNRKENPKFEGQYAIYIRQRPPTGEWRVHVEGEDILVLLDWRLPKIDIGVPSTPQLLGAPITISARIRGFPQGQIVQGLEIKTELEGPGIPEPQARALQFSSSAKQYTLELTDLKNPGIYTIRVSAKLGELPFPTFVSTFSLFPIPSITALTLSEIPMETALITVTANISNADQLSRNTSLIIHFLDISGQELMNTVLPMDSHDPNKNIREKSFQDSITIATPDRIAMITGSLSGHSTNGLQYSSHFRIIVRQRSALEVFNVFLSRISLVPWTFKWILTLIAFFGGLMFVYMRFKRDNARIAKLIGDEQIDYNEPDIDLLLTRSWILKIPLLKKFMENRYGISIRESTIKLSEKIGEGKLLVAPEYDNPKIIKKVNRLLGIFTDRDQRLNILRCLSKSGRPEIRRIVERHVDGELSKSRGKDSGLGEVLAEASYYNLLSNSDD